MVTPAHQVSNLTVVVDGRRKTRPNFGCVGAGFFYLKKNPTSFQFQTFYGVATPRFVVVVAVVAVVCLGVAISIDITTQKVKKKNEKITLKKKNVTQKTLCRRPRRGADAENGKKKMSRQSGIANTTENEKPCTNHIRPNR